MNFLKFFVLLLVVGLPFAQAIETDQFAAWSHELKDSSKALEAYLRNSIQTSLDRLNKYYKIPQDCKAVTQDISDDLSTMSSAPFVTKIENWLMTSDKVNYHSIGKTPWESLEGSVYKGYWRYKVLPFASTVNLYGVYMGVDKIGHFIDLGMGYYDVLLTQLAKGKSYEDAKNLAIDHGILLENTIYGTLAARVFSYGDMEANYQGMKWFESLCTQGAHTHLDRDSETGKWKLANAKKLSLKKYINPHWDESYYLNYYMPDMWKRVESSVVYKCLETEVSMVAQRFTKYEKISPSEQIKYLEQLESKGLTPKRRFKYLSDYCFE